MIKIELKPRSLRRNKDGETSVYFLISAPGLRKWFSTGIFLNPDDWDAKSEQIKKSSKHFKQYSHRITLLKLNATLYIEDLIRTADTFNSKRFAEAVFPQAIEVKKDPKLFDLLSKYPQLEKVCVVRARHYEVVSRNVKRFSPSIRVSEVDYEFMKSFHGWLADRKNSINTIAGKMRMIKAVVHYALRKKIIREDNIRDFRVRTITPRTTVLEPHELKILTTSFSSGQGMDAMGLTVLKHFIFQCYTGLRYSDLVTLKRSDIVRGCISIIMHKTKLPVEIPLLPEAAVLMDEYHDDGKVFKVLTNAAYNRSLKYIGRSLGLEKELTTKVARRTFATTAWMVGMDIKVIQKLLGHTTVRTTELYIDIFSLKKKMEMEKWSVLRVA